MSEEVILEVTTIEENVTIETEADETVVIKVVAPAGPTGATGPAGPNSVTSATSSDYTAELNLLQLNTGSLVVTDGVTIETLDYNFGDGSAQAFKDALAIVSSDIGDATSDGDANKEKILKTDNTGQVKVSTLVTQSDMICNGYFYIYSGANSISLSAENITTSREYYSPNASGTFALTENINGQPDKLTNGTISGTTTFNSTSYTYGSGAAAAHRTALGLTTLATTTPGTNVATFLATPTSDNLASALTDENGTGGGFVRAEGATLTSPSIAGTASFTGTTRPTSAGTGTPAATSLMTRDDVALEPFYNLGSVFRVLATPAFANSGTGSSSATQVSGDRFVNMSSGTANSGWARAQIGRGLTTVPSLSGAGINFASKLGASIVLWLGNSGTTDNLNIFRLRFGSDNTPVADGVDAVAYRGFGVEIKARGSSHDWRVYGHNGTSITYSAWSNTGLIANILYTRIFLSVISNGSGTITASLGVNGSRTLSTITTTGGPTTSGTSAQSFIDVHVANSASGTLPLAASLYDAMFYAQT